MTPIIDRDGRLFGLINLVDALCALFVLGLIPVAYGSLLLFRPAKPHIRSVERAEVNKEERRIANGLNIRLKLKVRGDHLTPMLRATIDDTPAIGFTFESPASADVIVGDVPLGTHDLILYDGAQEVARAPGAVAILPTPGATVRVVGSLIQLDEPTAKSLQEGQKFDVNGDPAAEFLHLGPVEPDRHRINVPPDKIDATVSGSWQRAVVLRIHCEPDPDASLCRIGMTTLGDPSMSVLNVPGAKQQIRVLVGEVLPDTAPQRATVRVKVTGHRDLADMMRPGDRDIRGGGLDERTATVLSVRPESGGFEFVLQVGLDRASDGWRYKAQKVEPGTPFALVTSRYGVSGSIVSLAIGQ